MNALHGSHYWMVFFPDWFLAVAMIFLGYGVLFLCRDHFEGLHYNVSFASVIGDTGLIGVVMIAAGIIKKQGVTAAWVSDTDFHYVCATFAIVVGINLLSKVRIEQGWFGEYADRYHNAFIAPMLVYLLSTLLPVIYYQGNSLEKRATIFFLILCFVLVVIDFKTGRMDQQGWLRARGVPLRSSRK
jgi:hypothetical protein